MMKLIIIILFLTGLIIHQINAGCMINLERDPPLVSLKFGSKEIITRLGNGNFEIKNGEQISLKCSKGLNVRNDYSSNLINSQYVIRQIDVTCRDNRFFYKINGEPERSISQSGYSTRINCENNNAIMQTAALYESLRSLPNCPQGMSYAIGTNVSRSTNIVNVGICYDFRMLSLKYVTYLPYRPTVSILNENATEDSVNTVDLDIKVDHFESLFEFINHTILQNGLKNIENNNELMDSTQYQLYNIIEDMNLTNDLIYESIFNIIWWKNLKKGSWKFFENELKKQIVLKNKYEIYTGTDGIADIPSSNCNKTEKISFEYKNRLINVPKYVWSYIKSVKNNSLDFVLVAYNTPYHSILNDDFICEDICDKIDWLNASPFSKIRLMPAYGIVICCTPEEVANKLENLPFQRNELKSEENEINDLKSE